MSQSQYIKGLPAKEYYRQWRKNNKEKLAKYKGEYNRAAVAKWRERNPEEVIFRNRIYKANRRARINSNRVEKRIKKENICNWQSKICGICKEIIVDKYHIDHIIPLSKGGAHSLANLQLAHPYCNQSKFTHLPEDVLVVI